jgi:hypothetical protein
MRSLERLASPNKEQPQSQESRNAKELSGRWADLQSVGRMKGMSHQAASNSDSKTSNIPRTRA